MKYMFKCSIYIKFTTQNMLRSIKFSKENDIYIYIYIEHYIYIYIYPFLKQIIIGDEK